MSESVAPQSFGAEEACVPETPSPEQQRLLDARAEIVRLGMTVSSWARANGHSPKEVLKVLSGRNKGLRGRAHNIAVKLGIKDGEVRSDV